MTTTNKYFSRLNSLVTVSTRKTAYNSGLAKVAVQCSAESFVVNQTLVLRINIWGKNRHLRQAAKRYAAPFGSVETSFNFESYLTSPTADFNTFGLALDNASK